jgi:hypothetical protein
MERLHLKLNILLLPVVAEHQWVVAVVGGIALPQVLHWQLKLIIQSLLAAVVQVAHTQAVRVALMDRTLFSHLSLQPAVEVVAKATKTVLLVAPAAVVVVMAAPHLQVEQPRHQVKVIPVVAMVALLVRHSPAVAVVEPEQTVATRLQTI